MDHVENFKIMVNHVVETATFMGIELNKKFPLINIITHSLVVYCF